MAVERRRADGWMWLFVDGVLEAEADGPDGDVSYPDDATPASPDDPYLVLGAEKFDAGAAYDGFLDELRISASLRYAGAFTRPTSPFAADADTAALYHLDEGAGGVAGDSAGASGGPSDGVLAAGGSPSGPEWTGTGAPLAGTPSIMLTRAVRVGVLADAGRQRARRLLASLRRGAGGLHRHLQRTARCCRRPSSTSTPW